MLAGRRDAASHGPARAGSGPDGAGGRHPKRGRGFSVAGKHRGEPDRRASAGLGGINPIRHLARI